MLHQRGCVRARVLSAWPWLARLSAGRPRAPSSLLRAFSLDPRALACICVSDLFLSRCEGQGLGVFCFLCEAVPRLSFQTLVVCCDIPSCGRASLVFADTHRTRDRADGRRVSVGLE